jgi:diguanylate cyclase (GGDEF)-like protein
MKRQANDKFNAFIQKRLLYVVVALALAVLGLSAYNLNTIKNEVRNNYTEKMTFEARGLQTDVSEWLDEYINILSLSHNLVSNLTAEELRYSNVYNKYLKIDYQKHKVDVIYLALEDGTFVNGLDWIPDASYDPKLRPWYIGAQNAGRMFVGDTYIDSDTNKIIFTISVPFSTKDDIKGVLAMDIYMNTVAAKIKDFISGTDFELAIVDAKDIIIHYTGDSYFAGQNINTYANSPLHNLYQTYLKTFKDGDEQFTIKDNDLRLLSKLSNTTWTLLIFTDQGNVMANAEENIQRYFIINAVVLTLILYGLYLIFKTTTMFKESSIDLPHPQSQVNEIDLANNTIRQNSALKSKTDELTRVFNHTYFDEKMDKYWLMALEKKTPIGLIIIDVDFFMKYNALYGQHSADELLVTLSKEMMNHMEPKHILARYSEEAFAILCYNTDEKTFYEFALKLQSAIEVLNIDHRDSDFKKVTISAGVAVYTPENTDEISTFIHKAYSALFKAKISGRNKVVLWSPEQ